MNVSRLLPVTAICLLAAAFQAAAFTGGPIRCGKITNFRLVDAVTFSWNTDDYGDQPYLADGEKFAIVSVNLAKERTIGKYDYTLNGAKCLAMASQQDPFDPSKWEFEFAGAATEVHMIYKVKTDGAPYSFNFELTTREPQLKISDTGVTGFGEGPNPAAFATDDAATTPDAATAAPGDAATDTGTTDAPADAGTTDAAPAPDAPAPAPAEDKPADKPKTPEKQGGEDLEDLLDSF